MLRLKPTDPVVEAQAAFRRSFAAWLEDLERTFAVVEPIEAHLGVHGQRYFELLLRAGSDFEAMARTLIRFHTGTLPAKATAATYRQLSGLMLLESVEVHFQPWRPKPLVLRPFDGWPSRSQNLQWLEDLNDVKHDRLQNASQASLRNVLLAGTSAFTLLAFGFGLGLLGATGSSSSGSARTLFTFSSFPLRLGRDGAV